MLVKRNSLKEKEKIKDLIESDPELKKAHELFQKEMDFKQQLINTRKSKGFTQKDISRLSGLSQQAVSRLERKNGGTLDSLLRYLSSMDMTLTIK